MIETRSPERPEEAAASSGVLRARRPRLVALLRRARPVFLAMLAVYLLFFGAGFAAGRLGWTTIQEARSWPLFDLNRNLESRLPLYGPALAAYKAWERPRLMAFVVGGKAAPAIGLIFFNNWIVANLTMAVRAALVAPRALYPYGRFVQGLTMARGVTGYQVWMVWLTEFGGYFLTITATLCAVLWTLFPRRFEFETRRAGLRGGGRLLLAVFLASGVFFLLGSCFEVLVMFGMSL